MPFYVEEDAFTGGGRRVAVHEFVKSEDHDTEDMGRGTKRYRLRAYVVGDDADDQAAALVEACDTPGDGVLQTLFWGAVTVKCTACGGTLRRDELGRAWMDMEFVDSGNGSNFAVVAIGDRIAASLVDTLGDTVFAALSAFTG